MAEEAVEKKEVPREQLLLFIKKLKVKVKDLEGELGTVKSSHADLQTQHAVLEEQMAEHTRVMAEKEEAFQLRLVKAGEEVYAAQAAGEAKARDLEAHLKETQAALQEARREQDGQIELAERCKRLETELKRSAEAEAKLKEAVMQAQQAAQRSQEESQGKVQALEQMLASATAAAEGQTEVEGLRAQVEALQAENAQSLEKLGKVSRPMQTTIGCLEIE